MRFPGGAKGYETTWSADVAQGKAEVAAKAGRVGERDLRSDIDRHPRKGTPWLTRRFRICSSR